MLVEDKIAVRDGPHFDVDVLPHAKSPLVELIARLVVYIAMFAMAVTFIIWGYDFAILGSRQTSEIAGLPMLAIYIAWPLAGATWVLFLSERIYDAGKDYRSGKIPQVASHTTIQEEIDEYALDEEHVKKRGGS